MTSNGDDHDATEPTTEGEVCEMTDDINPGCKFTLASYPSSMVSMEGGDDILQDLDDYIRPEREGRRAMFSLATSDSEFDAESTGNYDEQYSVGSVEGDQDPDTPLTKEDLDYRLIKRLAISEDEMSEMRLKAEAARQDEQDEGKTFQRYHGGVRAGRKPSDTKPPPPQLDFEKSEEAFVPHGVPIRRCKSLKDKISENTLEHKKAVRFADALGLDLESIRQVCDNDEPPIVPLSAIKGLDLGPTREVVYGFDFPQIRHLRACFPQPGYGHDFIHRVHERYVLLESCTFDDGLLVVSGVIRVANIAFDKVVVVRYTTNGWLTYLDEPALYLPGSSDPGTDLFVFTVRLPDYFGFSGRMEFSVMYTVGGEVYWDSYSGQNYCVECYVDSLPPRTHSDDGRSKRYAVSDRPFY